MFLRLCLSASCLLSASLYAGSHHHTPPDVPKDLEAMKQLAGTWEGTSKMGDAPEQKAMAVYEVTSGGTAVTSKLFPGQPQEMISVYHKDGKAIGMTHFCASGNAPRMTLKKSDGKIMSFEVQKGEGLSSSQEEHMHAVTLTLVDADTLKEEWTSFENGKKAGTVTFNFKRAVAAAAPAK